MQLHTRITRRLAVALALGVAVATLACWNGHNRHINYGGGPSRFQLVIESDRSDVDASHFLVDTYTGDMWRLAVSGARSGRWERLAQAPADARDFEAEAEAAAASGAGRDG